MSKKTCRDLKDGVADEEGAEDPAKMCVVDRVLMAYLDTCNGDICSIEIGDRTKDEEKRDKEIAHRQGWFTLPGSIHSLSILTIFEFDKAFGYQLVIDPSGRKYVCARAVTGSVISAIWVSCLKSNSTPRPGLSLGNSFPSLKSRQTGRWGKVRP